MNRPLESVIEESITPWSLRSAMTRKDTLAQDSLFLHIMCRTLDSFSMDPRTGSQSDSLVTNIDGLVHSLTKVPSVIWNAWSKLMSNLPLSKMTVSRYMRSSRGASTLACLSVRPCCFISCIGCSMVKFLASPVMAPLVMTLVTWLFPKTMVLDVLTRAPDPIAVLLVSAGFVTSAPEPMAVLCDPIRLYASDCSPTAVL